MTRIFTRVGLPKGMDLRSPKEVASAEKSLRQVGKKLKKDSEVSN